VTAAFWCPDAPRETRRVPCDSPDYGLTCTPDERCGYCDDGWTTKTVTECPDFDLSNTNTRALETLIGVGDDCFGGVEVEDIPTVLQRVMGIINRPASRNHLIHPFSESRGHEPRVVQDEETGLDRISTGPTVIDCGNTDEQTLRRLRSFQRLLVWAQEHGYAVSWA
jgi:hypothetical protein